MGKLRDAGSLPGGNLHGDVAGGVRGHRVCGRVEAADGMGRQVTALEGEGGGCAALRGEGDGEAGGG